MKNTVFEKLKENEELARGYEIRGILNTFGGLFGSLLIVQAYRSLIMAVTGLTALTEEIGSFLILLGITVAIWVYGLYMLVQVRRFLTWREENERK